MPVYAATFGFFIFASVGLPGLSGFVGEFLTLVGTFVMIPGAAAIATFVMILAAGYLLWMFQRVAFGELSDFLKGLGGHLTDMRPVEAMTLVPLAALVVVLGLFPGLLLDLINQSVNATLEAVEPRRADRASGRGRRPADDRHDLGVFSPFVAAILARGRDPRRRLHAARARAARRWPSRSSASASSALLTALVGQDPLPEATRSTAPTWSTR